MTTATFEQTYPKYPFAPLVALGLSLGKFIKARMDHSDGRTGVGGAHGAAA